MKPILSTLLIAAIAASAPLSAQAPVDCGRIGRIVSREVRKDSTKLLEVVDKYTKASPQCACDVVKAAIKASNADGKTVGSIVETAGLAAPDSLDIIEQCALAAAPDAKSFIETAVASVEAGGGQPGGTPNPLDQPGSGVEVIGGAQVGDNPGGPGSFPSFPPGGLPGSGTNPPIVNPPIVVPGPATPVNP
jgi:hypothetical protein